jgi:murein L,D-transpeptidase YcbB/YkuD
MCRQLIAGILAVAALWSGGNAQDTAVATPHAPIGVRLNVPAFRLDVFRDSTVVGSFQVAVGARQYPTPRGTFTISEIVWNPWWTPPPGEWAREDTVTPPGPTNPMGRVKLMVAPYYYIHGTPLEQSIGSAASHGCIRMRNDDVVALARLLQDSSGVPMPDSAVAALRRSRRTRVVTLPMPVPIEIAYRTAEVRMDSLWLYPDVYRLTASIANEALAALFLAGLDSAAIDHERLAALVATMESVAVQVPLDSVRRRSTLPDPITQRR